MEVISLTQSQRLVLTTIYRFGHESFPTNEPAYQGKRFRHQPISPCPINLVIAALHPNPTIRDIDAAAADLELKGLINLGYQLGYQSLSFIRDDLKVASVKSREYSDPNQNRNCCEIRVQIDGQEISLMDSYWDETVPGIRHVFMTAAGLNLCEAMILQSDVEIQPLENAPLSAHEAIRRHGGEWATVVQLKKLLVYPNSASALRSKLLNLRNSKIIPRLHPEDVKPVNPKAPDGEKTYSIRAVWRALFPSDASKSS
jgi:hypothetical protein